MAHTKKGGDLARMRIERGMNQAELGRRIGVDRSQVSRYEDGSAEPSLSRFRRMREVLGVSAVALLAAFDSVRRRGRRRSNGKRRAA